MVAANEVSQAESLLRRLKAADPQAPAPMSYSADWSRSDLVSSIWYVACSRCSSKKQWYRLESSGTFSHSPTSERYLKRQDSNEKWEVVKDRSGTTNLKIRWNDSYAVLTIPLTSQPSQQVSGKYYSKRWGKSESIQVKWISGGNVASKVSQLGSGGGYSGGMSGGTNSLGMKFASIPSGSFMMGSPSSESGRGSDERQHRVTLSRGFEMQTTEVTQGQYRSLMGRNPSMNTSCGTSCPVEKVTWLDAVKFANALSKKERLTPAYRISGSSVYWTQSANGYRLPTEAEWEYAARAGERSRYSGSSSLSTVGWAKTNSSGKTHRVSTKRANGWGLYDMSGNVWEWVWDYKRTYSGSVSDPTGNRSGTKRVFRGGSALAQSTSNRVARRLSHTPTSKFHDLGFRLVRSGY
jgi:formylglycine-generating enzyme required for sulfatase activity